MLRPGEKGEELLVYVNPETDWASYDKMLLDPVQVWRRHDPEEGAPNEDVQRMANNFHGILYKELSQDYEIVFEPGPKTIRVRVALTDIGKSTAALDIITTVVPVGIVISAGKDFITGKPAFVGEASIEGELRDAETGGLLAAVVDRRVGGKTIKESTNSWNDVNRILEFWSKLARYRLCIYRGGTDCVEP